MVERGTLYKTDGQAILLKPEDGEEFTLEELQQAVGGYVEPVVPFNKQTKLFVNEDGRMMNLPLNGHSESILDYGRYGKKFYVVGDAISTYKLKQNEAHDEGRMLVRDAVSEKEN